MSDSEEATRIVIDRPSAWRRGRTQVPRSSVEVFPMLQYIEGMLVPKLMLTVDLANIPEQVASVPGNWLEPEGARETQPVRRGRIGVEVGAPIGRRLQPHDDLCDSVSRNGRTGHGPKVYRRRGNTRRGQMLG